MEGRGRDPGRQDNPPQTHATRLGGITRLLRIRLPCLRAQPPHPSPQQEAHLAMTPHDLFRRIHVFLIRRIALGLPPARAKNHHHDVERGGRIAGTPRHAPEQTVHRSRRDGRPPLFSSLRSVRQTPPRPAPRMDRGTVRTSPPSQRPLDGPAIVTGGQSPTHTQHHKALLTTRLRDDVVHLP